MSKQGNKLQQEVLEPGFRMSPEEAKATVDRVFEMQFAMAQEKIGGGAFMQAVSNGTIRKETLRAFWLDMHQEVAEINNFIQMSYHTHRRFFIRNIDLMTVFADKVADELIHPKPPGHLLVVWKQGEIFGLSRDEMINHEMSPECRAYLDWHRGLLYDGTMPEFWASILVEEYVGHWARQFREGLLKMGYQKAEVTYFQTHEEADLETHEEGVIAHGLLNRLVLQRLLEQGYTDFRPGYSLDYVARTTIDIFARFFDYHYCNGGHRT